MLFIGMEVFVIEPSFVSFIEEGGGLNLSQFAVFIMHFLRQNLTNVRIVIQIL